MKKLLTALFLGAALLSVALGGAQMARAEGPNAIIANADCQAVNLPANDDGSSPNVPLPFGVNFFGDTYGSLWVNNNGNVTFTGSLSTFTPAPIVGVGRPLIAPFWGDVDTRAAGTNGSNTVHYGAITSGLTEFGGHEAFCVDWLNVGYYSVGTDRLNSFQLLLVNRDDTGPGNFDIVFNYDKVQWEAGGASGGSDGLGGSSARVGYTNGTPAASFELPGSAVNGAFLDTNLATGLIYNSVNSPFQPGRYIFPVRNGAATGHSLSGHVWANTVGTPAGGAFLQACPTPNDIPCRNATTNSAGFYVFNNLLDATSGGGAVDHTWNVTVNPPSGSGLSTGTIGPVLVSGADIFSADVTLHGPQPLPAGTTITSPTFGTLTTGTPTVYWHDPLTISTQGCVGGTGTATLTVTDGYSETISLTEGPSGTYSGTFAAPYPHHGTASISITIVCAGVPTTVGFDLYIDPSGTVVDTHGHPVAGATVTLMRSDDPAGPFVAVPNGSAIMSPANRVNPSLTDATGQFGWDVLAGYYVVEATAPGCNAPGDPAHAAVDSPVLTIPPPATGLVLTLECAATGDTTPPQIAAHGDVHAVTHDAHASSVVVAYTPPDVTDNVDPTHPATCNPAPGPFPLGHTTVTCTATDAAGNQATNTTFDVFVEFVDTTAPVIGPHADVHVITHNAAATSVPVTYTGPTATDDHDASVAVTCSPPSGSPFAVGHTTVTCAATDAAGNQATNTTFDVFVEFVDNTPPALTLPASFAVDATRPAGATVLYNASATDDADGSVTPVCTTSSGATFPIGDTTVTCTATDRAGNVAGGSFTVHVRGAAEQIAALLARVAAGNLGPGSSLKSKLEVIAASSGKAQCNGLAAFGNEVRAQTGKKLTVAQAAGLQADATRISAVLGC